MNPAAEWIQAVEKYRAGVESRLPADLTQTVTLDNLESRDWDGVVKKVYEAAYGSVLGIYDLKEHKRLNLKERMHYNPGCALSSVVDTESGRTFSVTFSATVPHAYAETASATSKSLLSTSSTDLVDAIREAKESIGAAAAAVDVPSPSQIFAQAPTITGGIVASSIKHIVSLARDSTEPS